MPLDEAVEHCRRALEVLEDTSAGDASRLPVQERSRISWRSSATARRRWSTTTGSARRIARPGRRPQARTPARSGHSIGRPETASRRWRRSVARWAACGRGGAIEAAHLYQELGLAAFRTGDNARRSSGPRVPCDRRSRHSRHSRPIDPGPARRRRRRSPTRPTQSASRSHDRGDSTAARERIEQSLAAAEELGLLDVACRAYANLGVLYSTVEPKRAIEVSLTGLEIASKIGAASLQSYIYANLAAAYCALTDRCETDGLEAARTPSRSTASSASWITSPFRSS